MFMLVCFGNRVKSQSPEGRRAVGMDVRAGVQAFLEEGTMP